MNLLALFSLLYNFILKLNLFKLYNKKYRLFTNLELKLEALFINISLLINNF